MLGLPAQPKSANTATESRQPNQTAKTAPKIPPSLPIVFFKFSGSIFASSTTPGDGGGFGGRGIDIAMLSLACLAHTGAAAPAAPPPKHMPVGPAAKLPFGAYPGYRVPFQNGECDADDPGGPGSHPINTKKRCFSCFRIPAVTITSRHHP